MKKILPLLALTFLTIQAKSQKKDFEGRITYSVTTKSKTKNFDDSFYKLLLAANGDRLVVTMKNGMIKQSLGVSDTWYIGKAKKLYIKFRNIDTLYYRDYSSDTSRVTGIIKSDSGSSIQGFPCKSITLKKAGGSSLFLYTDSLQFNTEYEKDNTNNNLDILIREIGKAMWLYNKSDYSGSSITDSCLHVEQGPVDDQVFVLPAVPIKKLSYESLIRVASFPGNESAWPRYLKNNLDGDLGLKYIKISKGEKSASVQVLVRFIVSEDGSISHIEVINKADVDSHLATEAMRVIRESPPWVPASIYGIKTKMPMTQPVVFAIAQ